MALTSLLPWRRARTRDRDPAPLPPPLNAPPSPRLPPDARSTRSARRNPRPPNPARPSTSSQHPLPTDIISLSRSRSRSRSHARTHALPPIPPPLPLPPDAPTAAVYGYTPASLSLELSPAQATALLVVVSNAIVLRGLQTPLLFSPLSLALTPLGPPSLIRAYLGPSQTPPAPNAPVPPAFVAEAQFASPSDLASVLKWALARIATHIPSPHECGENETRVRGFLSLDTYLTWRHEEQADAFPSSSYADLTEKVSPQVGNLLTQLLSLLSSAGAYALENGMTIARLARTFGPLIFGLPEDDTFARTYAVYVRATNATEHLLLAYVRQLETTLQAKGSALPLRLAQAVQGYPATLPGNLDVLPAGTGKVVPLTVLERSVKAYAPDLLADALTFDLPSKCKEWDACHLTEKDAKHGVLPQFTPRFRKLINFQGGVQVAPSQERAVSPLQSLSLPRTPTEGQSPGRVDPTLPHSLADKVWTDFVSGGFTEGDNSKLAFDLQESAREAWTTAQPVSQKQWGEFAASGFDKDGTSLSEALAFSSLPPQRESERDNERDAPRKKKVPPPLPAFPYDLKARVMASPTMSSVARTTMRDPFAPASSSTSLSVAVRQPPLTASMDETFAEVWADYLWCGGWSHFSPLIPLPSGEEDQVVRMLLNRRRAQSWVVVQYKSRGSKWSVGDAQPFTPGDDPRTDATYFVVSETVPEAYRAAMEAYEARRAAGKWGRVHALFKRRGGKTLDSNFAPQGGETGSIASSSKKWASWSGSGAGSVFGRRKPAASLADDFDDPDDPFRPGRGGTTRHITLASTTYDRPEDEVEELTPQPVAQPVAEGALAATPLARSTSWAGNNVPSSPVSNVPLSPSSVKLGTGGRLLPLRAGTGPGARAAVSEDRGHSSDSCKGCISTPPTPQAEQKDDHLSLSRTVSRASQASRASKSSHASRSPSRLGEDSPSPVSHASPSRPTSRASRGRRAAPPSPAAPALAPAPATTAAGPAAPVSGRLPTQWDHGASSSSVALGRFATPQDLSPASSESGMWADAS